MEKENTLIEKIKNIVLKNLKIEDVFERINPKLKISYENRKSQIPNKNISI